jgi:hypothetical protein
MEFDEMKKIWDAQNNEPLYTINEKALHNRILSKKKKAQHITNVSELLWIIGNIGAGGFVAGVNFFKQNGSVSMFFLSVWMVGSALYLLANRVRRIKANDKFDRSMRSDLQHAVSTAAYQVRLSQLGRWNIVPVGILSALGVWEAGSSVWWIVGLLIFLIIVHFAAGWEHNIYKRRKHELQILQDKLEREESGDRPS